MIIEILTKQQAFRGYAMFRATKSMARTLDRRYGDLFCDGHFFCFGDKC